MESVAEILWHSQYLSWVVYTNTCDRSHMYATLCGLFFECIQGLQIQNQCINLGSCTCDMWHGLSKLMQRMLDVSQ